MKLKPRPLKAGTYSGIPWGTGGALLVGILFGLAGAGVGD